MTELVCSGSGGGQGRGGQLGGGSSAAGSGGGGKGHVQEEGRNAEWKRRKSQAAWEALAPLQSARGWLSNCLHAGGQGAREDCHESSDKCRTSVF